MTINITIPSDDATIAGEIGLALVRIAQVRGFKVREPVSTVTVSGADHPEPRIVVEHAAITDTSDTPDTRITDTTQDPIDAMEGQSHTTQPGLDKDGLPWDARIHSASKDTKTDGTWRLRRKPKDQDESAWEAYVAQTTESLRALMAIPAKMVQAPDLLPPPVEVDEPTAPTLTPPVIVPPPIVTVEVTTFAQLMTWLTSRTPKDDTQRSVMLGKVNGVVELHGLKSLQDLQQRQDLIPQVLTDLRAQLDS